MPCRPGGVGRGSSERQLWVGLDYRLALDPINTCPGHRIQRPGAVWHGNCIGAGHGVCRVFCHSTPTVSGATMRLPPLRGCRKQPTVEGVDCTLYAVELFPGKTEGLAAESAASLSLNTPTMGRKDAHLLLRVVRSIETIKPKMSLALTLISDLCLFI